MKKRILAALLCFSAFLCRAEVTVTPVEKSSAEVMPLRLGGVGGVYFYVAAPGKFNLTVMKQERTGKKQPMRAIFAGPDREVLADLYFPGTGNKETQQAKISCDLPAAGVYCLNITAPGDWYGEKLAWSFVTDCPKYMIETTRAHRDARHEDPVELLSPEKSASIVFSAYPEKLPVKITGMIPGSKALLRDASGAEKATLTADAKGTAQAELPADAGRSGLWRLDFERAQGKAEIGELTVWQSCGYWEDTATRSLWTTAPEHFFDFAANRRLLTPHFRRLDFASGTKKIIFQLHNYAGKPRKVTLQAEYPDGGAPFLKLPADSYTVEREKAIVVKCDAVPVGSERIARIRVNCDGFSTYSTVKVSNNALAEQPLSIPIKLQPYKDENYLFAYDPGYPMPDQITFTSDNRPVLFDRGRIRVFRDGGWRNAKNQMDGSENFSLVVRKIGIDDADRIYLLGKNKKGEFCYLYSTDGGASFAGTPIPGTYSDGDLEQFNGWNVGAFPPPVTLYRKTSGRRNDSFWRQTCEMYLVVPEFKAGKIVIPEPLKVTDKSIGIALHSGMASTLASHGGKVHIIWGEATDPADKSVTGVPTFVASFDRQSGKLGKAERIGFGPPVNDVHNTPSILVDKDGFVHAFVGSHGLAFQYARSLDADAASGKWSPAARVLPHNGMTYIGVVCDKENVLHLVYRQWRGDHATLQGHFFGELAMIEKPAAGDKWSPSKALVQPPFSDYSVFYHRLAIDRKGKLFVSYDCWTTYWFYRNDQFGSHRVLLVSPDGGKCWRYAGDADLQ